MKGNVNVLFPLSNSGGGGGAGGVHYMGTVASASDIPASPSVGDLYIASAAFSLSGEAIEAKDMIIWNGTSWDVIQGNIESLASEWDFEGMNFYSDYSSFNISKLKKNGVYFGGTVLFRGVFYKHDMVKTHIDMGSVVLSSTSGSATIPLSSSVKSSITQYFNDPDVQYLEVKAIVGNDVVASQSFFREGSISSSDRGFVTGDAVHQAIGDVETLLASL